MLVEYIRFLLSKSLTVFYGDSSTLLASIVLAPVCIWSRVVDELIGKASTDTCNF